MSFTIGNTAQLLSNGCEVRFFVRLYNEDDARLYALLGRIVQSAGKYASKRRQSPKGGNCAVLPIVAGYPKTQVVFNSNIGD